MPDMVCADLHTWLFCNCTTYVVFTFATRYPVYVTDRAMCYEFALCAPELAIHTNRALNSRCTPPMCSGCQSAFLFCAKHAVSVDVTGVLSIA